MDTQSEKLAADLLANITELSKHSQDVENMLAQTLSVMSKLGNQAPFNVNNVMDRGDAIRKDLVDSADRVFIQIDELDHLVRTSALITTSLEIDQVLEDVIDTVIRLTGAERAYLMLVKGEDDLHVVAARNNDHENIDSDNITFSRGVISTAINDGTPIVSTNAQEDERFQEMHSVMRNDLRSIMVIPMMLQGVPLGVLYLDNRLAAAVFHKKSIPILTAFANQAAIAIENARLFERVQESLVRTQREVKRLRIQLDQNKLNKQVDEITESEYFKELAEMAKNLRTDRK